MAHLGVAVSDLRKEARKDPEEIADVLDRLLPDPYQREVFGWTAQRRVHDEFLLLTQVRRWLEVLAETVDGRS